MVTKRYTNLLVFVMAIMLSVSMVSALTWRHGGVDRMVLDDGGNLNVSQNVTVSGTSLTVFNGSDNLDVCLEDGTNCQAVSAVANPWTNNSLETYIGATYPQNVNFTGNLTMGDRIDFILGEALDNLMNGWIRITGNLIVTQNINATYNVSVGDSLTVANDASIIGNLSVGDTAVIANNLSVGDDVAIGGDLAVAGSFSLSNLSVSDTIVAGNNLSVGDDLAVAGDAFLANNLDVGENITAKNVHVENNITIGSEGKMYMEGSELIIQY